MSLFDEWINLYFPEIATATPATSATHKAHQYTPTVAKVATVAVAKSLKDESSPIYSFEWIRKGLSELEAETLHFILLERDKLIDDRKACIECRHSYMKKCKKQRSPLGHSDIYTLHRCVHFSY